MITILLLGCEKQTEDQTVNLMIEKATEQIQDTKVLAKETPLAATQPPEEPVLIETPLEEPQKIEVEDSVTEPETLGNPRSSYGLGSAAFLKGRNVLVSLSCRNYSSFQLGGCTASLCRIRSRPSLVYIGNYSR